MLKIQGRRRPRAGTGAVLALAGGLIGLITLAVGPQTVAGASGSVNAELAQAKAKLLVKSDFPAGWAAQGSATTTHANDPGTAGFPGLQQLGSCLGLTGSQANVLTESTPEADSPTFSHKDDSVAESLDIYPSAKLASESYQDSTLSKVPACFASLMAQPEAKSQLENSLGKGATLGTVTAAAPPKKDLIPNTSGVVLELPLTQQGQTNDIVIGIVNWARGTENPALTFSSVNTAFPGALAKQLETVAYNRS